MRVEMVTDLVHRDRDTGELGEVRSDHPVGVRGWALPVRADFRREIRLAAEDAADGTGRTRALPGLREGIEAHARLE